MNRRFAQFLLLVLLFLGAWPGQGASAAEEDSLIATLKSDAPLKAKADACRMLARVGSAKAIPTLAALLADEQLSHMARYALEPMPDDAVDVAFRNALKTLKGRPLVGVIGSVGVRRDKHAVSLLIGYLGNADAVVADAAARALGRFGSNDAATALETTLKNAPADRRAALFEGLFRCAETMAASGNQAGATAMYDRLRTVPGVPHQIRTAALRGAVLTRGDAGIPLIIEAWHGESFALVAAAARCALELPGTAVVEALGRELGKLPPERQILLCQALGKRREPVALPALSALARKGESAARVAAVRAIPEIGDASATGLLVELQRDQDADVAGAAREALGALAGAEIDAALIGMLSRKETETRRLAVELLGQRRVSKAVPMLLKTATDDRDEAVRSAALEALGDLAGRNEFTALIKLLLKARSQVELRAAEGALSAICVQESRPAPGNVSIRKAVYGDLPDGKQADVTAKVAALVKAGTLGIEANNGNFGDPAQGTQKQFHIEYSVGETLESKTVREGETVSITAAAAPQVLTDALCTGLEQASGPSRLALLRVLRTARGPKALAAVQQAAVKGAPEVRDEAISLLAGWPSVQALPNLLQLAKAAPDPRTRVLALRGCYRLIPLMDAGADERMGVLEKVLALTERPAEKRLALSALTGMATPRALDVATAMLASAELRDEAGLAAVAIAEQLLKTDPAAVAKAMQAVVAAGGNGATSKRAKQLLAQARKAAAVK